MANKAFAHFGKVKTQGKMSVMYKHNFRLDFCENADASKTHLNEVLIGDDSGENVKFYSNAVKKRIKESEYYKTHKVRRDAVLGLDVQLNFGKMETVGSKFDLNMWKAQSVEWLKETFGEENVISAVLHMDEKEPHIHAFVVPMVGDILNCKALIGTKDKMITLQDTHALKMANLGLERGAKYSVATHTEMKQFYAMVKEIIDEELPDCRKGESAAEYKERAESFLRTKMAKLLSENLELKAQNASLIGNGIEVEKLRERNRELEDMYNTLLRNINEKEKASQNKTNDIMYAIEHKLPSEAEAIRFANEMNRMANLGREASKKEHKEKKNKRVQDTEHGTLK